MSTFINSFWGGVVIPPSDLPIITSTSNSSSISTAAISFLPTDLIVDFYGDMTHSQIIYADANNFLSMDLSSNIGVSKIDINNLDKMNIFQINNANITSLNLTEAINLTEINPYGNDLTSIDISNNTLISKLLVYYNNLTSLDISNNTLLTNVTTLGNVNIPTVDIDNIYIQLDAFGLSNGILWVDTGLRSAASDSARANLLIKNWNITD